MVGVGEGLRTDGPRIHPVQLLFIHEDAHQFWDGKGWVCIIQLNRRLFGEDLKGGPGGHPGKINPGPVVLVASNNIL